MRSDYNERLLQDQEEEQDNNKINFKKIFVPEYNNGRRESEAYYLEHCQSAERLAQIFRTDLVKGLDSSNKEDLAWREKKWGNNHLPPEEENSILAHIIDCFKDTTLQVLVVAAIVSLIIGIAKDGITTGWIEGTAIASAVLIVVSITSYMNYDEKEQFLKLSRETKLKKVIVIRDGKEKEISLEDILVGDILKIRIGDIINVDGIVYGDAKADMDESPVTGESDLMRKVPRFEQQGSKYQCPFVFSGSQVQNGTGNILVVTVGADTFEGSNQALISSKGKRKDENGNEVEDEELTPLKLQLKDLADRIGTFGYCAAIAIGSVMIVKEVIIRILSGLPMFDAETIDVFVNAFIIAVTVIVVAIPEGLPMAVTISLAYSVQKMKEEHNLVKHLDKSETMGNVNNVCTDKTGTLTEGVMSVIAFFLEGKDYRIEKTAINDERLKKLIFECMYKNITVVETTNDKGECVLNGDMTEKALYKYLKASGYSLTGDRKGLYVLPFKSEYKYMMNIYKDNDDYILYAKGAPERVQEFFRYYQAENGEQEEFEAHKEKINQQQASYAEDSIRTLVFGYKKITAKELNKAGKKYPEKELPFFQELAKGLTFGFMVGIRDNNRKDVPDAIQSCKRAGITVRMVTGDNINTALAISKDVGIIDRAEVNEAKKMNEVYRNLIRANPDGLDFSNLDGVFSSSQYECPIALEGEVFRQVCGGLKRSIDPKDKKTVVVTLNNIKAFAHISKRLRVVARASPEDKFLLVAGLRELDNIVAVTGDGTNDAPALKKADVGFAMGIRGTDIAKNAADIVLLDDSFSSIVTACKYGRNVYDCIRKFIQFQLTTNIVAVFMTFLGGIILKDSPLNAIEMLWVNLIMDSFASLALATESPSDELLNRMPYKRGADILTPMMYMNIISQAIFQIIILIVILFYGDVIFGVPSDRGLEHFTWNEVNGYHFTIFFNIFVFMQVCNSINARKLNKTDYNVFKGILGNWYYIFIQSFIIVGQMILVTFGGRAVRTHRLTILQHLECLAIASITLVVGFLTKFIPIDTTEKVNPENLKMSLSKSVGKSGIGYASRGGMKLTTSSLGKRENRI